RRDDRVNGPGHDAVSLQPAQRDGEHPGGDAVDAPVQFGESHRALPQQVDDVHRPFVADALEYLSRAAARRLAGRPRFTVPRRIARRLTRLALRVGWPGFHDIPSLVSHQATFPELRCPSA